MFALAQPLRGVGTAADEVMTARVSLAGQFNVVGSLPQVPAAHAKPQHSRRTRNTRLKLQEALRPQLAAFFFAAELLRAGKQVGLMTFWHVFTVNTYYRRDAEPQEFLPFPLKFGDVSG